VRDLATEIRSEVRGSVRDLRSELMAAAKDVRRVNRAQAREERESRKPSGDPFQGDLERSIEWFRSELRTLTRHGTRTAEDVVALRDLLQRTLDEARRILER
jgi:hypothetical protein